MTEDNLAGAAKTDFDKDADSACVQVDGSFKVIEMTADADAGYRNVASFTATWEQRCVEGTGETVGCVHFTQ